VTSSVYRKHRCIEYYSIISCRIVSPYIYIYIYTIIRTARYSETGMTILYCSIAKYELLVCIHIDFLIVFK
jgi:hypothetical protein